MRRSTIHPTAVVHSTAVIGNNVCIGEFALIEPGVRIGDDCHIAAHTVLRTGCELGNAVSIDSFCVIAGLPQTRAHEPSPGKVSIGDHTIVREAVTVNLPTKQDGVTSIGSDCYLMANCHVNWRVESEDSARTVVACDASSGKGIAITVSKRDGDRRISSLVFR